MRYATALAGLTVIGFTPPAYAGSFSVNPVQLSIASNEQMTSLIIKNNDAASVAIQVETMAWNQAGGNDQYNATSNIIVSPPIFTIKPGATQLIRVGLKEKNTEIAYRVIFAEIPKQKKANGQVQVILRLNLPLYLLPKGEGKSDVSWRALRDRNGAIVIEGTNRGNLYQQVTEIDAKQDGKSLVLTKLMGVVLPGSSRIWRTDPKARLDDTKFVLITRSPAGDKATPLLVEKR